ncbi:MAG: DUF6398 domain-containing protein [Egibacteraceae bacterium]
MEEALQRLRVPVALRPRVGQMLCLVDGWCAACLDEEYAALTQRVIGKLGRKRLSPLTTGQPRVWAAGALYAVGQLNYLMDARRPPHLTADELSALTGVAKSTLANKARQVRELAGLRRFDPECSRSDIVEQSHDPFVGMVDGRVVRLGTLLRALARTGWPS